MKKAKKWIIFIISIFSFWGISLFSPCIAIASDQLRVALSVETSSGEFVVTDGQYELVDFATQLILEDCPQSVSWLVTPIGKGNLQITKNGYPLNKIVGPILMVRPKDPTSLNVFKFQGKRYRDILLIENVNGKLNVINYIDIEKYLYGVVGAEMGSYAPLEALKAQAVVSRTYALYYKKNPQMSYDLGINTSWQVYGGYDMEVQSGEQVKNAVDSTRGQVIFYNGDLIQAFFHANSGGFTENSENVWWAYIPYIRAVPSPGDLSALNYPAQEGGWPANTYQWSKNFSLAELEKQFALYNKSNPNNPIKVGKLLDIRVSRFAIDPHSSPRGYLNMPTPSTRVTELEIVGTQGSQTFYRDNIRSVFDLRSSMFEVFFDSTVEFFSLAAKTVSNTAENLFAIGASGMVERLNGSNPIYYVQDIDGLKTVPKKFTQVTFSGKGYGHGLGMSQWGARGLAAQGYNYMQIIQHYYNNNNYDGKLSISTYPSHGK
ncbi:MAG: SpoIID/LytB domain-containing protein [Peptococcales bacterium]